MTVPGTTPGKGPTIELPRPRPPQPAEGRWPRRPAVHRPSMLGRARADRGPLLLAGLIVALATLLVSVVPPRLPRTADSAVADAVRRAGTDADIVVEVPYEDDFSPGDGRRRDPRLASEQRAVTSRADLELAADLRAKLRTPVTTVSGVVLKVTDGSLLRTFQFAYVTSGADATPPPVRWIARGPPKAAG